MKIVSTFISIFGALAFVIPLGAATNPVLSPACRSAVVSEC
jgi:hypothetical protein